MNQAVSLLRDDGQQAISALNDDQLASVAKTVMLRNVDVDKSVAELARDLSCYGKIMRLETAQTVANPNLPSQSQVEQYLQKSPVDNEDSHPVLKGEGLFQGSSKDTKLAMEPGPVTQSGQEHLHEQEKVTNQDFRELSLAYMKKHFRENPFPFWFEDSAECFSGEEQKAMGK